MFKYFYSDINNIISCVKLIVLAYQYPMMISKLKKYLYFYLCFQGTASAKEFYKRNHQWTEGLISAAKAVGMGAKFLLTAADKVVSGQGKFEQLVVASQEIAASTAQRVVASRVKADRNSKNMSALSHASKGVTQATGGVVATAKSCSQMVEENGEFSYSALLCDMKSKNVQIRIEIMMNRSSNYVNKTTSLL